MSVLPAEQKDPGFEVASTSCEDRTPGEDTESDSVPFPEGPGTSDEPDARSSLPTPSDILVSYSTFPGEHLGEFVPRASRASCPRRTALGREELGACLLSPRDPKQVTSLGASAQGEAGKAARHLGCKFKCLTLGLALPQSSHL